MVSITLKHSRLFLAASLLCLTSSAWALSPLVSSEDPVTKDVPDSTLRQKSIDYSQYSSLLETYVTPSGVKYEAWFSQPRDLEALDEFLGELAAVDLSEYTKEEQFAFYLNLYNAAMLQAVFDHYPIESVKEIGFLPFSIFKKKFIRQGERKLSLDQVEKEILLKEFFDPRIHFAVNCASESCPPLMPEPFEASQLDAQLEAQTIAFSKSTRAARVIIGKKRVAYSELFKWYEKDFGVENPAEYLNRYREKSLPLDYVVDWIDYDWSLNSVQ